MGGKSKAPPPPDYTPIANASAESAKYSYELGKEQLQWAKDQYASDKAITDQVVDATLKSQAANDEAAAKDRARYESVYQPLEDDLVADAKSFASPERKELEMGRAQANVAQQFDGQRQAALQALEGYGVDPTSTRYAALDIGTRAAQAAATAGAGNQASEMVDAQGRALRSEALNIGKGYPGQIATQYGVATQAGNSAVNDSLATTASGASTMGTANQWQGTGNQAVGIWGNTLNMGYQNQLAAYKANQDNSSGWGSALGLVGAGIGAGIVKGPSTTFLADGGAIDPEDRTVPPEASPTQGVAVDDVPARLNVGEFVIPREAVQWFGEKYFQSLIQKAEKEKGQAGAKPEVRMAPPQQPTFQTAVPA